MLSVHAPLERDNAEKYEFTGFFLLGGERIAPVFCSLD